jgi:hypothetical protein
LWVLEKTCCLNSCGLGKGFGWDEVAKLQQLALEKANPSGWPCLGKGKRHTCFGKGMWVLEKTSFIIVAPVALEKALACCFGKGKPKWLAMPWKRQKAHMLLGKACGFWKRHLL